MADDVPPDPSAEVFLRSWIRPTEVLRHFAELGSQVTAREVYRRLCEGMLFAAGSPSAIHASKHTDPRSVILPPWWKDSGHVTEPGVDFWRTAGVTVNVPTTRIGVSRTYEFFGVRFEPEGLQRMAEDAGIAVAISPRVKLAQVLTSPIALGLHTQAPKIDPNIEVGRGPTEGELIRYHSGHGMAPVARRARDNPMTTGEIKAWYRSLTITQKSLGIPALWELAKSMNPGRHLPRKLVEPFGEGRGNGHRARPQSPKKSSV